MFNNISIGIDIEEISRFENKSLDNDENFLRRIFTENELNYCFSKKNYSHSLTARFCAKEAVIKALSAFGIKDVYCCDIEILNYENGMPYATINKYSDIQIKISLSHCKNYATANVILYK